MNARPAVIVLGAGRGSRFIGTEHKLLQSLGNSTVFGTTLRHAIESQLHVVVVTTEPLAEVARRSIAARDVIVIPEVPVGKPSSSIVSVGTATADVPMTGSAAAANSSANGSSSLGMGFSISAGVAACGDAGGWLVLPADMPMVLPTTLQNVARQLATHAVVYAQYKGRRGHPVGFSAELYSELAALSGDEGARRLVARYPAYGLDVDDPGVLIDVDTQADLDRVRQAELPAAVRESRW